MGPNPLHLVSFLSFKKKVPKQQVLGARPFQPQRMGTRPSQHSQGPHGAEERRLALNPGTLPSWDTWDPKAWGSCQRSPSVYGTRLE